MNHLPLVTSSFKYCFNLKGKSQQDILKMSFPIAFLRYYTVMKLVTLHTSLLLLQ